MGEIDVLELDLQEKECAIHDFNTSTETQRALLYGTAVNYVNDVYWNTIVCFFEGTQS